MKKIFIFGANGMLGRYVTSYLTPSLFPYPLFFISLGKNDIDARMQIYQLQSLLDGKYKISKGDVIINCAGAIKPMVDKYGIMNAIDVNTIFPLNLQIISEDNECHFIHITTDCVYAGDLQEGHVESDPHNAPDVYGKTKSLGEPEKATVIRCSILGEEKDRESRSLLQWAINNKNKTVDGYALHFWNGITCLRLAKIIADIIVKENYWEGVKHVFSKTTYTKYDLLRIISTVYDLNLIVLINSKNFCSRILDTERADVTFEEFDLIDDLIEQRNYSL